MALSDRQLRQRVDWAEAQRANAAAAIERAAEHFAAVRTALDERITGDVTPDPAPDPTPDPEPNPDPTPEPEPEPEPEPDPELPPDAPGERVGRAELPRVYITSPTSSNVTGVRHVVRGGESIQAAIDRAQPGDEVVIDPGYYVERATLRRKEGAGYVTIRGAAELPDRRVRAGDVLPRIVSPYQMEPVTTTESGARGYVVRGLDISAADDMTKCGTLVALGSSGSGQATLDAMPRDIHLDRCHVRGHATLSLQRAIALHTGESSITRCRIDDAHAKGYDTQAIWGCNGTGPYLIEDNYLAGAGENVMFGGADPRIPGLIPSDIVFRRNYVHKPREWKGLWTVKNLFELKIGRRVLIEGNVFDGVWPDAQIGFAFVLKSTNENGASPWGETSDVVARYNVIRNATHGVSIAANPQSNPAVPASRMSFVHNLMDGVTGRLWQLGAADLHIENNTMRVGAGQRASNLIILADQVNGLAIRRNVFPVASYGLGGDGVGGWGEAGVAGRSTDGVVEQNLFPGGARAHWPSGTNYLTEAAAAASGIPLGANLDAVAAATAGVADD